MALILRPVAGSPIRLEDADAHALATALWQGNALAGAPSVAAAMTRELHHRDQDRRSIELDADQTSVVLATLERLSLGPATGLRDSESGSTALT